MVTPNIQVSSKRKAKDFSDAESFGLFMEALRDLQFYAENSASDEPDSAKLDENLDDARDALEKCYLEFPEDLLPRYYLAITLTMQNQRLYAQEVANVDPSAGSPSALLAERPWPLLDRAADLFEQVMNCGDCELSTAAKFNLAHVFAKRDYKSDASHKSDLERARDLLDPIPALPVAPKPPSPLAKLWEKIRGKASSRQVSLYRKYHEDTALAYQARTLRHSIEARIALKSKDETALKVSIDGLLKDRADIEKAEALTMEQKHDLLADSWTKSGFLMYSFAAEQSSERQKEMTEAENSLHRALQYKPHWIPAQTYLAMVQKAKGNVRDASRALLPVLGKTGIQAQPAAKAPDAEEIVAYILAMPLGTPAATISSLTLRGYGPLGPATLQKVVLSLTQRKLKPELIDEITKGLEPSAPSTPTAAR
jgi:hypothetical protein